MKELLRNATALHAATLQEAALHAATLREAAEETTAAEVRLTLEHLFALFIPLSLPPMYLSSMSQSRAK